MEKCLRSILLGALLLVFSITPVSAQLCECGGIAGDPLSDSQSLNVVREWLQAHNKYRCMHNVPPVVWSVDVSKTAEEWAKQCTWGHSDEGSRCPEKSKPDGYNITCGENVSVGRKLPTNIVDAWYCEDASPSSSYCEEKAYSQLSNGYTENYPMNEDEFRVDNVDRKTMYGHFSQAIWKNTKEIGCLSCPSAAVPGYSVGKAVCQYYWSGNIPSQFLENVPKRVRSSSECEPSLMNYTNAWQSSTSQWASCWRYSGRPIPEVSAGDPQCGVCWQRDSLRIEPSGATRRSLGKH